MCRQRYFFYMAKVALIAVMVGLYSKTASAGLKTVPLFQEGEYRFHQKLSVNFAPYRKGTHEGGRWDIPVKVRLRGINNMNVENVSLGACGVYGTYGKSWSYDSVTGLTKNGDVYSFTMRVRGNGYVNGATVSTPMTGQMYCVLRYTVVGKEAPKASMSAGPVYHMNGEAVGSTAGAMWINGVLIKEKNAPNTQAIGNINWEFRNPTAKNNGVWTSEGVGSPTTTVTKPQINATLQYQDSITASVGDAPKDLFSINGSGTERIKWKWTATGDLDKFYLDDTNNQRYTLGTLYSYKAPVRVHPVSYSTDWRTDQATVTLHIEFQ